VKQPPPGAGDSSRQAFVFRPVAGTKQIPAKFQKFFLVSQVKAVAASHKSKKPARRRAEFPAHAVEGWPAEKLKPYARNARLHGAEQIAQLRSSFRQFGQVRPILVRQRGDDHRRARSA
jgi:hypothetical protein